MLYRTCIAFTVVVALLALATPALAGGWAVVTLDTLPHEVRAGQQFQLGFVVRQHGKTPTNTDLDGKPLKPVLLAHRQDAGGAQRGTEPLTFVVANASASAKDEQTIRIVARQEGAVGHYVADVSFPSDGVWAWQIEVPTFYVQNNANGREGNAAIFAPLTVLPAIAAPAPQLAETTVLGVSPSALRWSAILLLLLALGIALYTQRGALARRRVARPE